MSNVTTLPKRGQTYNGPSKTLSATYGTSVGVEGVVRTFDDLDSSSTSAAMVPRSSKQVTCVFVRNTSALTLQPKRVVKWESGYRNRRVDGYATTDWAEAAGVVDEFLTNGVRQYDMFWLAVKGPSLVKTSLGGDATNVIAVDDKLAALTGATSGATTSGRVQAFAATSNLTNAVSAISNLIGYAMSAKTTGNTNADVLVDLCVMKS